jgi:hypothetical protein
MRSSTAGVPHQRGARRKHLFIVLVDLRHPFVEAGVDSA